MRRLSHAFPGRRFRETLYCFLPLPSPCVTSFVGGSYILICTPPSLARTLVYVVVKTVQAVAVAVAGVCSTRPDYVSRVFTPPNAERRAKQINFLSPPSSTTTMAARKLQSTQQDSSIQQNILGLHSLCSGNRPNTKEGL